MVSRPELAFMRWKDNAILSLRLRRLVLQYPAAFAEAYTAGYEARKEEMGDAIPNRIATDIAKLMASDDFSQILVRRGENGRLEIIAFTKEKD